MAEAGAKFEWQGWVGRDGEDVRGDDLAGEYQSLCGHWPWNISLSRGASCLEYRRGRGYVWSLTFPRCQGPSKYFIRPQDARYSDLTGAKKKFEMDLMVG